MNLLHDFKTKPFIDAVQSFFEKLKVPFNVISDLQTEPENIIGDKKCNEIISAIYPFGIVTDGIFDGKETTITQAELNEDKYVGILLFGVELTKSNPTRSDLAEITRQINRAYSQIPVVVVFRYADKITFANAERLKYLRKDKEGDKIGQKVAMLKDIEINNTHRAHLDILKELAKHNAKTFEELYKYWQEKLNTKELNNKFYQELFKWYLYAKDNVVFPNDNQEEADKYLSESLIRFISRMLFVWFMKEKSLITHKLFETNELKNILKNFEEHADKNIYYKAILQNLFFATLNVPTENRKWIDGKKRNKAQQGDPLIYRYENEFINSNDVINNIFMKIPFLNGGLFDCLDDRENNIFTDGFTKNEKKQPQFPNFLFFGEKKEIDLSHHFADDAKEKKKWQNQTILGIIDLLNNYKFTVEENTPLEVDVALDPELLGKVFENLLASFNPETKATARKQTGSFYTPREIVNYMVDESLKAYVSSSIKCTSSFQLEKKLGPSSSKYNQHEEKLGARSSEYNQHEAHFITDGYFDPNNEIIIHKKKLPHWQQENVWYFVTFRLADSIPEEKKEEIRREREIWDKNHKNKKEFTKEDWIMYNKLFHENTERLLNSGYGKCLMNKKENADIVANALLHFNNERYILDEWVVMSNHVHVLVKPIGEHYLGDILHSWKSFTANEINKREGLSGQLWMTESYDHIVRNRESFNAIRYYIRENPSKAKITVFRASSQEQTVLRASSSKEFQSTVLELFSITSHEQMSDTLRARSSEYVQALFNCKILDPACGSGAYPMGVLHKMVQLMTILDPKNEHLKQIMKEKVIGEKIVELERDKKSIQGLSDVQVRQKALEAVEERLQSLEKIFNNEYIFDDYARKLYIIENCIYGVDIQPIAIQISKLRFFISLLVEQNKKEDQPNFGIEPLPNMDFKLVAANTLIAPPQEDKADQTGLFADQDLFFETFENLAHDYFTLHTPEEKKTKKQEIITLIKEKIEEKKRLIASSRDFAKLKDSVKLWESYQNLFKEKAVGFFETKYFFPKVKEGFDVVIGNPPYVNVEKIDKSIKDNISKFKTAYQKYDLYVLFYESSLNLLKEKGLLNFITSNKFLSQGYGLKLRQLFLENRIIEIINFNFDVFETATVRTCIFHLQKNKTVENTLKIIDINTKEDNHKFENKEYQFLKQNIFNELEENNFRINLTLDKVNLINKLEIDTLRVDDICSVNYGLRPSSEKLGLKKEDYIFEENVKGNFKKYFEGKDMGYWLVNKYSYLNYQPDEIYNPMFKELFEYEKLVGIRTLSDIGKLRFIYDNKGFYCNDSVVNLTLWHLFENVNYQTIRRTITKDKINNSKKYSYQYLQGILNSKIIKFYVNELLYDGTHFYPNHMKQLPIKISNSASQQPFITLVNEILEIKKFGKKEDENDKDTTGLEHQIDVMVYHLYGLSYEEACVIDNGLKEEDYRTSSFQLEA
ncbi:hypothetical protein B0A58_04400 [Flavobacterium branchiophilum NBRC 15030 = ATCC 35035]|uniref:site-specific DNA-methyltransferase (adenine-specific) n=1 Tax=Flavobacterium branchiophilum TaxID=55197 RepID=A0A543G383_9FLAO|nr:Eco57I restriction-modification methylase domain-containing protein [Flavobacterium branchiophilum]OXA78470.1 hypothetical protein B0A58_04400 [Flavobacterium branchiophilum NBRC 15030 = ATCC 35035]TQM40546.1 transposase IS200 family protein [Flavobacterium branchiophilum]GEM55882.1 hypothetical protein FB1_21030 [Flavobacterium branchiophilum NBRC 15030 = ATCC 35035]